MRYSYFRGTLVGTFRIGRCCTEARPSAPSAHWLLDGPNLMQTLGCIRGQSADSSFTSRYCFADARVARGSNLRQIIGGLRHHPSRLAARAR